MGYRSLKKYLGETNLERKCRWLFGICLFGLIFFAFFLVDWIGEDLVKRNIHRNGREWVRDFLYDAHWEAWETDPTKKPVRATLSRLLLPQKFEARVIALDRSLVDAMNQEGLNFREGENQQPRQRLWAPDDPEEAKLLESLKSDFEKALAPKPALTSPSDAPLPPDDPLAETPGGFEVSDEDEPFKAHPDPESGRYYFYQPVSWQHNFCKSCHEGSYGKFAMSASESFAPQEADLPFLVVRVALPYSDARAAINWTRAVLLAVGILTVFMSMVALWMVVKYVVIKPLSHLRSVSEAVTRGDLQQRADIHTNDEFEDLAASFNKMLRHLTDAQSELKEANYDLDAKVDQLAQLNMRLHEMNRLKGEFLANMSHELRTPLNSIIGFSEVLAGIDSLTDKQKRYAQNIQKSGRSLLEMINDILDLAKLEAGKMDVRLSEFRIDSILSAHCDMVRSLTEDKNIDLVLDIENDLPALYQDQAKLQQILTNLLSNAIKFTPEGGRITVGAKGDSRGFIEMYVSDTGVGIADADKEIIFEKFRQGTAVLGRDNLTREYSGTGLGLSIVKELCKLLGGEVSVESELGRGSTFRVTIPWMRADQPQAAAKLQSRLDDLTKPRRLDFQRGDEPDTTSSSQPAAAGS